MAWAFGLDLEQVGRIVSYLFLLACLFPVSRILRALFPDSWKLYFWVFTSLFLTSPEYLFLGRAFLIETTALFFTLCFLDAGISFVSLEFRWPKVAAACLFLSLALLQKVTTVLPLLIILAVVLTVRAIQNWSKLRVTPTLLFKVFVALVLPVIIGYSWTRYSDQVKSQNPLGMFLTAAALVRWNFGTLEARFSSDLWVRAILGRMLVENISGISGLALLAVPFLLQEKQRLAVVFSLAAFLAPILIFENLHAFHSYYQMSNGIFLILGISVALAALAHNFPGRTRQWLIFLGFCIAVNLLLFGVGQFQEERLLLDSGNNQILAVSKLLREATAPEKRVVIYGNDWSSEIAFFSERRTFTVPALFKPYTGPIQNPALYVEEKDPAIVLCGKDRKALAEDVQRHFSPRRRFVVHDCEVFLDTAR